jgi:hypothetical protein
MKKIDDNLKKEVKEIIQSSNINFLIGAGASRPYLPVLGNIEKDLLNAVNDSDKVKIFKKYFKDVMLPNLNILDFGKDLMGKSKKNFDETVAAYSEFYSEFSTILMKRKSSLLSKQANIFTTNIDLFMEMVLEDLNIEYNDGFFGRINPKFDSANFKKTFLKRSLQFENISEIPTFNLIKLHGSLSWKKKDNSNKLFFSRLSQVKRLQEQTNDQNFEEEYRKLAIINPDKKKFEETVMDLTYYDMLRMFSGEMERETTVLFIVGFSLEDEHIRDLIFRSANSNPTLKIYVFCYDLTAVSKIESKINYESMKYENIEIIQPSDDKIQSKLNLRNIVNLLFKNIFNL